MPNWLPHAVVTFLLYCTWYSEMVTSLCGLVQLTISVGLPCLTALDRDTPVTWEGACVQIKGIDKNKTPIHVWPLICNSITMPNWLQKNFNEQYLSCDTMVYAFGEAQSPLQLTVHIYWDLSPLPACHWKSSLIPLYRWKCISKSSCTSEHILQATHKFLTLFSFPCQCMLYIYTWRAEY